MLINLGNNTKVKNERICMYIQMKSQPQVINKCHKICNTFSLGVVDGSRGSGNGKPYVFLIYINTDVQTCIH